MPDYNNTCFVIMPFGKDGTPEREHYDDVYQNIIRKAVEESGTGLICKRADDIKKSGNIPKDIYRDLYNSKIVIADLSELNPNVMYELGVRYSYKHGTILIKNEDTTSPFDTVAERAINYSVKTLKKRKSVVNELGTFITNMAQDFRHKDSPVLEALNLDKDENIQPNNDNGSSGVVDKSYLEKFKAISILDKSNRKQSKFMDLFSPRILVEVLLYRLPLKFNEYNNSNINFSHYLDLSLIDQSIDDEGKSFIFKNEESKATIDLSYFGVSRFLADFSSFERSDESSNSNRISIHSLLQYLNGGIEICRLYTLNHFLEISGYYLEIKIDKIINTVIDDHRFKKAAFQFLNGNEEYDVLNIREKVDLVSIKTKDILRKVIVKLLLFNDYYGGDIEEKANEILNDFFEENLFLISQGNYGKKD